MLVALFVVAPLVELYVIVRVAGAIGALDTIALLVLVSLLGAWLVKRQGLAVLSRLRREVEAGRDPSRALVNGALVVLAGLLLIVPGFVSDALGLLLLLPPVRALVAPVLLRRLASSGGLTVVRTTGSRRLDGTIDADAWDTTPDAQSRQLPPELR